MIPAADVKSGAQAFQSHMREIDLVMIDVEIGGESGFALAGILEERFRFYDYVFFTAFFWEEKTLEELLFSISL